MEKQIYKEILSNGFKDQNTPNLGVRACFINKDRYIEVYQEKYGFSVFLYGKGLMNGYFPFVIDVLTKKDIHQISKKLKA